MKGGWTISNNRLWFGDAPLTIEGIGEAADLANRIDGRDNLCPSDNIKNI